MDIGSGGEGRKEEICVSYPIQVCTVHIYMKDYYMYEVLCLFQERGALSLIPILEKKVETVIMICSTYDTDLGPFVLFGAYLLRVGCTTYVWSMFMHHMYHQHVLARFCLSSFSFLNTSGYMICELATDPRTECPETLNPCGTTTNLRDQ